MATRKLAHLKKEQIIFKILFKLKSLNTNLYIFWQLFHRCHEWGRGVNILFVLMALHSHIFGFAMASVQISCMIRDVISKAKLTPFLPKLLSLSSSLHPPHLPADQLMSTATDIAAGLGPFKRKVKLRFWFGHYSHCRAVLTEISIQSTQPLYTETFKLVSGMWWSVAQEDSYL